MEQKQEADDKLYEDMRYSALHGNKLLRPLRLKIADITYMLLNTKLSEKCFTSAKPQKFYFK